MTPPAKTPSLNPFPLKERMKMPRQHMLEQPAQVRATNFTEVNLGYSTELARQEALRCLECAKPACTDKCPVGAKVREFVQLIVAGDFLGAAAKIREDNVLPAITGRVCPQEDHCEGSCLMGKKVQSLGIGYLERFVADYEQQHMDVKNVKRAPSTGKKVAIVGSGPSGLQRRATSYSGGIKSTSSRRCTRLAECWFTAFRNSGCPRRSSANRSTTCARWASSSRLMWWWAAR
jgi:glutamate synthase (NADPH/NADH) small chain